MGKVYNYGFADLKQTNNVPASNKAAYEGYCQGSPSDYKENLIILNFYESTKGSLEINQEDKALKFSEFMYKKISGGTSKLLPKLNFI